MTSLSTTAAAPSRFSYVRELWRRREFATFLALGNLKARNASTTLGLLWWILNPLLLAAIYFFVFGVLFQTSKRQADYLAYLLSGMFVFTYSSISMTAGANSILANSRMLANLSFPRLILPLSALVEAAIGFLTSIIAYYLIVIPANGLYPTWHLIWLIPAFVLHTIFNLGLASLTARLAVPFRDVNNLVPYLLRLWLYLSPIIWPITFLDSMPSWAALVFKMNPMFVFLRMYRAGFMASWVGTDSIIVAIAWTIVIGTLGVYSFIRAEGKMVRYL